MMNRSRPRPSSSQEQELRVMKVIIMIDDECPVGGPPP